ncbi:MAG: hypothetical protein ACU0B7_12205, partial [Paracoccaceae bacterium]
ATFALNAGLWFLRGRLVIVISSLAASCCCCAENPLIPAVQIFTATSVRLPRSGPRAQKQKVSDHRSHKIAIAGGATRKPLSEHCIGHESKCQVAFLFAELRCKTELPSSSDAQESLSAEPTFSCHF